MRDPGFIDALDALERYARAFDVFSREQDAHYSARSFVRWLRLETTAPKYGERRPQDEAAALAR
jgi:Ca2+-binding EF-hand superfamily protein